MGNCCSSSDSNPDPLSDLQDWIEELEGITQYETDTHIKQHVWRPLYFQWVRMTRGLADIVAAVRPGPPAWAAALKERFEDDAERIGLSLREQENLKCRRADWLRVWQNDVRPELVQLKGWMREHRQPSERPEEVLLREEDLSVVRAIFDSLATVIHGIVERGCDAA